VKFLHRPLHPARLLSFVSMQQAIKHASQDKDAFS
jgi:hypothetical protein